MLSPDPIGFFAARTRLGDCRDNRYERSGATEKRIIIVQLQSDVFLSGRRQRR